MIRRSLLARRFVLVVSGALLAPLAVAQKAPIQLNVDLTDAPRRIFHAKLVIPISPGPVKLVYPKWIPGEHSPTGPIADLAGLKITAAGKSIVWQRDLADMYAIHCTVPEGAAAIEVELDYLPPVSAGGFTASPASTAQLAVLNWNTALLYPQGAPANAIPFAARLRLPAGWKFGTALPVVRESGEQIEFANVPLETLVDSPVIAGRYLRTIDLGSVEGVTHSVHLAGDSAASVEITPEELATHRHLVTEANALFGARHYRSYHFLLALSDYVESFGLEHHESSDNRGPERTLTDPVLFKRMASLLPHEYTHSWNGKFRRPADLTTADYQQVMRTDLLWVYEGLTQYLGEVLTARGGFLTPEDWRENLAHVAAYLDHRSGRVWRPLEDTAVAAQNLYSSRREWGEWRRDVDFYDESTLIWLEVDTVIRQQSHGHRSLDDFCRRFHGAPGGPPQVKTYTLDDVVAALNETAPYDWRAFFDSRVYKVNPRAPLGGINGSGWRLVYNETPNEAMQWSDASEKSMDASFSLGLKLREDGTVNDVLPFAPAAVAGMAPGMKLIAVNGRRWSPQVLRDALRAGKNSTEPLEFLVENAEYFKTVRVDYHGGERYPHLERDSSKPDLLEQIIKPLTWKAK